MSQPRRHSLLVPNLSAIRWVTFPFPRCILLGLSGHWWKMERMFPDFFRASGLSAWRFHLVFDLLVAAGLALATASIGVMGAFGLVFVPSMIAYRIGPSWKCALLVAIVISLLAYITSFLLAFMIDQPFGPVLVIVLSSLAVFGYLVQIVFRQGVQSPPGLV
jgi:ABC-type Mn2+/Zn2+ transport system permease subunit